MKAMLISLALAATAGSALAQETPPPPQGGGMTRADANGDGVITREEIVAQATQRFDRLDLNRDGKLTRDELQRVGRRAGAMRGGDMPPAPPAN